MKKLLYDIYEWFLVAAYVTIVLSVFRWVALS